MQYSFRLDKLHVTALREYERPDKDYLVFAVKINDQTFIAPASQAPTTGFLWELSAGRDVALFDTGNPMLPDRTWEIGPFEVGDQDVVTWTFVILNSWNGTEADTSKILGAVAGALLATGSILIEGGIGVALGLIGAVLGGISALLPSKPDCDGPVAADLQALTGSDLKGLDYQFGDSERSYSQTVTYSDQKSPSGCGSPKVDITHTIATPITFIATSPPEKLVPDIQGDSKAWTGTWADTRLLEESSIV
ncbi:MAG TPA: hypothetical protein VF338_00990, partial [Leptolinea sp.]